MPDYGAKVADKAIARTERKLRAIYQQAANELKKKLADFTARFEEKQTEMLALRNAGVITEAKYKSWLSGQVFIGKQWKAKVDQAARIMDSANREAALVVTKNRLDVFAENYNHSAYELEKKVGGAVSFNLYSSESVARLVREKPQMLPKWKIDEKKDYIWNRQKVENSVTQGIIQGESVDQIADRLVSNLCTQNENKMRTFARTAMTGAQNAGRQAQMEDAEDMGIKLKKRWLATLDDRTRDTHAELDGQEVPVDDEFEVDGMKIMYPGDPHAEPEMVFNCRCTMIQIIEGIDRKSVRRAYNEDEDGNRTSGLVEDMTYAEWKEGKRK